MRERATRRRTPRRPNPSCGPIVRRRAAQSAETVCCQHWGDDRQNPSCWSIRSRRARASAGPLPRPGPDRPPGLSDCYRFRLYRRAGAPSECRPDPDPRAAGFGLRHGQRSRHDHSIGYQSDRPLCRLIEVCRRKPRCATEAAKTSRSWSNRGGMRRLQLVVRMEPTLERANSETFSQGTSISWAADLPLRDVT